MSSPNGALPPGPSAHPILQTAEYVWRPLRLLEESHRRYGDAFTIRLNDMPPTVVLADPEAVREVYTGSPDLLRSGEANERLQAGLGRRGLIVLDGADHLRERKLMLPPFHGKRIQRYGELIAAVAERRMSEWEPGRPFPVATTMRGIALEVILRAVLGLGDDAERMRRAEHAFTRFLDALAPPYRLFTLFLVAPGGLFMRSWERVSPLMRRLDAVIYDEIERGRADPRIAERDDVLAMLLQTRDEAGQPVPDEHLRDELVTILAAGHETTATALAWALERLVREPAVLERLMDEVRSDPDGDDYLDAVVKETLRLRTIVPFSIRRVVEPTTIAGLDLPAGVNVAPSIHLVHRNPRVYAEPEAFRPERFLDEAAGTYTWIPFGGGTRRCLGAAFAGFEMKTVLHTLLRLGRVSAPDGAAAEPVARRGITFVPARGGRVVWHPG